jgi:hypothetical protein
MNRLKVIDASAPLARALSNGHPRPLLARPPDEDSDIVAALTEAIISTRVKRDTFSGQPVRASEAGACARRIAFGIMHRQGVPGVEPEPMAVAEEVATQLGTEVHERWFSKAMDILYGAGNYQLEDGFELPEYKVSGHSDATTQSALIVNGHRRLEECKTGNGTYFKLAAWQHDGIRRSAFLQAGLNGLGHDADEVRISFVARESVSVQKAKAKGVSKQDPLRVMAAWTWTRDEYEPPARAEGERMRSIADMVNKHIMPLPILEDGRMVEDCETGKCDIGSTWECHYCDYQELCLAWERQDEVSA